MNKNYNNKINYKNNNNNNQYKNQPHNGRPPWALRNHQYANEFVNSAPKHNSHLSFTDGNGMGHNSLAPLLSNGSRCKKTCLFFIEFPN